MSRYVVWKLFKGSVLKPIACSEDPGAVMELTVVASERTYCRAVQLGEVGRPVSYFTNAVDGRLVEGDVKEQVLDMVRRPRQQRSRSRR